MRVFHRERLQERDVDELEQREVESDAEAQDEEGGERESGRPAHHAESVAHVLGDAIEPVPTPNIA